MTASAPRRAGGTVLTQSGGAYPKDQTYTPSTYYRLTRLPISAGGRGLSGAGSNAGITDTNRPPDQYQQPYSEANFTATQRFWFTCPGYNNGAIQSLAPDVAITRRTFLDTDGFWKYQITKSSYTNTIKMPNQ